MFARALVFLCLLSAPSAVVAGDNNSAVGSPTLKGNLLVQWNDEKRFIYVTDSTNPLRFQTADGREIKPGRMYTDGGSIPRVFWAFPGFSPWGYAPAYVLHDWLFHQHRCQRDDPPDRYTLAEANQVLDDTIGILFKLKTVEPNETARALIKWAVDNFAQRAWDQFRATRSRPLPASDPPRFHSSSRSSGCRLEIRARSGKSLPPDLIRGWKPVFRKDHL